MFADVIREAIANCRPSRFCKWGFPVSSSRGWRKGQGDREVEVLEIPSPHNH
jgi:hypothetical protein